MQGRLMRTETKDAQLQGQDLRHDHDDDHRSGSNCKLPPRRPVSQELQPFVSSCRQSTYSIGDAYENARRQYSSQTVRYGATNDRPPVR